MYKGDCGVNNINETIQDVMSNIHHTKDKHLKRGFMTFYLRDRVIQTQNNYDKSVFNGDMGFIVDIDRKVVDPAVNNQEQDFIVVDFYGDKIMYIGDEEISELKLAWCITVHKFQGSQCRNIVFILVDAATIMASKELLYTAMTRAEKKLDIYGHMSMFKLSPTKSVIRERYTNLVSIVKGLRENRQVILELI
jgi:exodeoxyribonuclease V alpha subunit